MLSRRKNDRSDQLAGYVCIIFDFILYYSYYYYYLWLGIRTSPPILISHLFADYIENLANPCPDQNRMLFQQWAVIR